MFLLSIGISSKKDEEQIDFQNNIRIKQEQEDLEISESVIVKGGSQEILASFCETKLEEKDKKDFLSIQDEKGPYFCDKSLFESSSNDGFLNSLEELTMMGTRFFLCCLHLLLKSDERNGIEDTCTFIEDKRGLDLSKSTVFKIINSWVANPKDDTDLQDMVIFL